MHYLEQLFRRLRNGTVVKSVRGPGGGYVLARTMDQITVKDVLDSVGENINPAKDILGSEAEVTDTVEFHLSKNYFQNLGIIMKEYLVTTSLGDLVRKSHTAGTGVANESTEKPVTTGMTDEERVMRSPLGEINRS